MSPILKCVFAALTPALLAFPAASNAQDRDGKKFEVVLSPRLILPPLEPVEKGMRKKVMPGDLLALGMAFPWQGQ